MGEDTEVRFELAPQSFLSTYKLPIFLGSISIILIVLSLILLVKSTQTTEPIRFSGANASPSAGSGTFLTVDIEGAVTNPGVYTLPQTSRIDDAIAKAGGLSKEADTERIAKTINRAAKLTDGMKLFLPTLGETTVPTRVTQSGESVISSGTVSINTATRDELIALYGIGPATADKIIAGRPYTSLEELLSRHILNASLYTQLKDILTL